MDKIIKSTTFEPDFKNQEFCGYSSKLTFTIKKDTLQFLKKQNCITDVEIRILYNKSFFDVKKPELQKDLEEIKFSIEEGKQVGLSYIGTITTSETKSHTLPNVYFVEEEKEGKNILTHLKIGIIPISPEYKNFILKCYFPIKLKTSDLEKSKIELSLLIKSVVQFKVILDPYSERAGLVEPSKIIEEIKGLKGRMVKNPFGKVRAEDFTDDELNELFTIPEIKNIFYTFTGENSVVLEGGIGSGKSMILRSISLKVLGRKFMDNPDKYEYPFVGIFVSGKKLVSGPFDQILGDQDIKKDTNIANYKKEIRLFISYFNFCICQAIFETMIFAMENKFFGVDVNIENKIVKEVAKIPPSFQLDTYTFESLSQKYNNFYSEIIQSINNALITGKTIDYRGETSDEKYLHIVSETLLKNVPHLTNKNAKIFILLDEYETFSWIEQKAINTILTIRESPLRFKIGMKALGLKESTDLRGGSLQIPGDYIPLHLDFYPEDPEFRKYLIKISCKRLQNSPVMRNKDITKLLQRPSLRLEKETNEAIDIILSKRIARKKERNEIFDEKKYRKNFIGHYRLTILFQLISEKRLSIEKIPIFSRFDTFMYLSSGNIRNFIELCRDSLVPLLNGNIPISSIPPEVQHSTVLKFSQIFHDRIPQNAEPKEFGPKVQKLCDILGDILRKKLHKYKLSDDKMGETESIVFEIYGFEELSKEIQNIIDAGIRGGAIQKVKPRNPKEIGCFADAYALNRILVPYYEISYRDIWPMRLSVKEMNNIFRHPKQVIQLSLNFKEKSENKLEKELQNEV